MLYSIKNRKDFENLEELASLKNQVEEARLQVKLGKQNFHENKKKFLNQLLVQLKIPLKNQQKLFQKLLLKTTKH